MVDLYSMIGMRLRISLPDFTVVGEVEWVRREPEGLAMGLYNVIKTYPGGRVSHYMVLTLKEADLMRGTFEVLPPLI